MANTTIDDRNPSYMSRLPDWEVMDDCYEGQRQVKAQGTKYLPATSGMLANGYGKGGANNLGDAAYNAYRIRAVFYPFVYEAVTSLMGMIHRKPPTVKVPKALDPMIEKATINGEHISVLWQRITEYQLRHGGCGALIDIPSGESIDKTIPYVALYARKAIPNWDQGVRAQGRAELELVVLDESGFERVTGLRWEWVQQYRILAMSNTVAKLAASDQAEAAEGTYQVGVSRTTGASPTGQALAIELPKEWMIPQIGGKVMERIPFVFINTNDTVPDPCMPPLLGLAELALAIYRGDADYRQSLHMQGQDTLVREGADEEQQQAMTGAGAILDVPMMGSAYYIGVSSSGLSEQREALENDKEMAGVYSNKMDRESRDAESGEAIRTRISSRTATLASIQRTTAQAIKDILTMAGEWMGLSEGELAQIEVTPNVDFSDEGIDATSINSLMDAIVKGLPLSRESLHAWLVKNEFTSMTFEDEMLAIAEEKTSDPLPGAAMDIDPETGEPIPPGPPNNKMPPGFGKKKDDEEEEEEDAA